jgi:hypothetical protein
MSWVTGLIGVSFFPACLLILGQVILVRELSSSLLAAGLFALCIDQARMADLDIRQVIKARQNNSDVRLKGFWRLTLLTIIIELTGFYLASQFLGWGIQIVLFSQLGFNTFATIQIKPSSEENLLPRPWKERFPLMLANSMAMGLMALWMANIAPLTIVSSLWAIAIVYTVAKLGRWRSANQKLSDIYNQQELSN